MARIASASPTLSTSVTSPVTEYRSVTAPLVSTRIPNTVKRFRITSVDHFLSKRCHNDSKGATDLELPVNVAQTVTAALSQFEPNRVFPARASPLEQRGHMSIPLSTSSESPKHARSSSRSLETDQPTIQEIIAENKTLQPYLDRTKIGYIMVNFIIFR
jgi:hypothetical protein